MVFVHQKLQEEFQEQKRELCATFVNLTKAFDTVSNGGMSQIIERFGWPPKLLNMIIQLHVD